MKVEAARAIANVITETAKRTKTIETSRRHWNWWGSAEMCKFVLKKRTRDSRLGAIRDIVVDNVIARPRGTSTIIGHAERPIENVRLSNIDITMLPENAVDKRATHALYLEHVRGARIRDLSVRWSEDASEPKWQSALVVRRVSEFEIADFTGDSFELSRRAADQKGIDARLDGDDEIALGGPAAGTHIRFYLTAGEAEAAQFEGGEEGSEQIGAALLFVEPEVNPETEDILGDVEKCLSEL